jgi:hypothetical protein
VVGQRKGPSGANAPPVHGIKNALLRREVSSMDKKNERTSFSNEPPFQTNLFPLEFRREIFDLQLFYKSKSRLIPMDVNNYLRTYDPGYTLRRYDENNFYFLKVT